MHIGERKAGCNQQRVGCHQKSTQPVEERGVWCLLRLVVFEVLGKHQMRRIVPAGAPAPTRRPIRLRPWAMICRRLAMYWSGLWTLTVIEHSLFLVQPMAIFTFKF